MSLWHQAVEAVEAESVMFCWVQDRLPILQNFVAFAIAAAVFRLSPLFKPGAVDLGLISKEGRRQKDEE